MLLEAFRIGDGKRVEIFPNVFHLGNPSFSSFELVGFGIINFCAEIISPDIALFLA